MSGLVVRGLSKSFGAIKVIESFDLTLRPGERHAVIGPNGAGKTTLFNMLSGWLAPDSGTIEIDGQEIRGRGPTAICHAGVARSFQRNTLFGRLTVHESLWLALNASRKRGALTGDLAAELGRIAAMMELDTRLGRETDTLSYGQKRQLEVALALACQPRILLLDEPAAGTSPAERATLVRLLGGLPGDLSLVLVEHDMDVVFGVCEAITVLNYGRVVISADPGTVRNDPDVRMAYLGREYA